MIHTSQFCRQCQCAHLIPGIKGRGCPQCGADMFVLCEFDIDAPENIEVQSVWVNGDLVFQAFDWPDEINPPTDSPK